MPHPSPSPIFILGNPRSGTTLLRLMLACHPRLAVPPECGFALWLRDRYGDWSARDMGNSRLEQFLDDLFAARKFDTWGLDRDALREWIRGRRPSDYRSLVESVYWHFASMRAPLATRIGDKNNFHIHRVADLASLFPGCVFIHIVRDGRDVACSYREVAAGRFSSEYRPDLPQAMGEIARQWRSAVLAPEAAIAAGVMAPLHTVRFEDLVSDPMVALRPICDFLGEPFSEQMLEYHTRNASEQLEPAETMAWKRKTLEPLDHSVIARHRQLLTEVEIAQFNAEAGDALQRFGYGRHGRPRQGDLTAAA